MFGAVGKIYLGVQKAPGGGARRKLKRGNNVVESKDFVDMK